MKHLIKGGKNMMKLEQAKKLIDSMDETEKIMMLSLLLEVIWAEETNVGESVHDLVTKNAIVLLGTESSSKSHNAEVIDFTEYKNKKNK